MNKNIIIQWLIRIVLLLYAIINFNAWVQVLVPKFYNIYFSKLGIYEIYNFLGGWLLLVVIGLIILHITNIFRVEKKVFWILVILFLLNLLIMYLEVRRHGDS